MPRITFITPGLLPPPAAITEANLPECKYLQRLLARADCSSLPQDAYTYLLSQFGYARDTSAPFAALTYLADSGATRQYIMRADPVHLSAGREGVILFDNTMLKLQSDDAESLAGVVQPLLDEFAAELKVQQPDRWYLLCKQPPQIHTCPLMQAVGRDVSNKLPTGNDQTRWRQLFNEIQMLLHETPVNQARERRGQLPVNSLWFWGGGELAASTQTCGYDVCVSDDPVVQGLARQQKLPLLSLPDNAEMLLAQIRNYKNALIVDNRAHQFQAYQDGAGWLDFIAGLEANWIRPLTQSLLHKHMKELWLITENRKFIYRQWHRMRFWRQSRLLAD